MSHPIWRRAAAAAGVTLIASALPVLSVAGPAQATETVVHKSIAYTCTGSSIIDGLGEFAIFYISVDTSLTVPTLVRGGLSPVIPVSIGITVNQDVHADMLRAGARLFNGEINGGLRLSARPPVTTYPIEDLSVRDVEVEQDPAKPFSVVFQGSLPPFRVPDVPVAYVGPQPFEARFSLTGDAGRPAIDYLLSCGVYPPDDYALASVPLEERVDKATPSMSAALRTSPVVQNVTKAKLSIRTNSDPQATGGVTVEAEDGHVIAEGTLDEDGDVVVDLPAFGRAGRRALTVKYGGDAQNRPVSQGVNLVVARQVTPEIAARVRTVPVLSNKTRATLSVRTSSRPQATGTVNVRTEDGRTIATGRLDRNGDTLITLPVFGRRGARTLTIVYPGDTYHRSAVTQTALTVR